MLANYETMTQPVTFVPEHMRDGISRYIEQGIRPGSFLTAVVQNDLREAIGHADDINLTALPTIVAWFYNYAPALCWGSTERMMGWLLTRRDEAK